MIQTEFQMIWSNLIDRFLCILGNDLLSALSLAYEVNLAFFCFESSGVYFLKTLSKTFTKIT
jgi:hypothetical protein